MGRKILVIDDNRDDLLIIRRYLKEAGFSEIVTAENGREGMEKIKEEKPDLIISDTLLPDTDGFEICRQVKGLPDVSSAKVIIITGSIDAVDAVKARRAGADDYFAKTSDYAPLIEAVKKLV